MSTGSSIAKGLRAPVRPTLMPIIQELRDLDFGRELPRDGPARFPVSDYAELLVQAPLVHLHHDAVGAVVEGRQERLELGDHFARGREIGDGPVVRLDRNPQRSSVRSRASWVSNGRRAPGASTWKQKSRSFRARVILGSSWRRDPAAEFLGFAKVGSPAASRSAFKRQETGVLEVDLPADFHQIGPA